MLRTLSTAAEVLTGFAIIIGSFLLAAYALLGWPRRGGDGTGGQNSDASPEGEGSDGGGDGGD